MSPQPLFRISSQARNGYLGQWLKVFGLTCQENSLKDTYQLNVATIVHLSFLSFFDYLFVFQLLNYIYFSGRFKFCHVSIWLTQSISFIHPFSLLLSVARNPLQATKGLSLKLDSNSNSSVRGIALGICRPCWQF